MAFAKFQENWFGIDREIAENHAILVNLTASIVNIVENFKWLNDTKLFVVVEPLQKNDIQTCGGCPCRYASNSDSLG